MIVSKIPRGRMLELDEAAAMICWLASAEIRSPPPACSISPAAARRIRTMI